MSEEAIKITIESINAINAKINEFQGKLLAPDANINVLNDLLVREEAKLTKKEDYLKELHTEKEENKIKSAALQHVTCSSCPILDYLTALSNASEIDGLLVIVGTYDENLPNKILIRPSYPQIYDLMIKMRNNNKSRFNTQNFHITGTPGIGKSYFVIYIIYCLLKNGTFSFIYSSTFTRGTYYYYDHHTKSFTSSKVLIMPFMRTDYFMLIDGDEGMGILNTYIATKILITSPNSNHSNEFLKLNPLQQFIMPIWSKDEFTTYFQKIPEAVALKPKVDKLFAIWGGIPRFLLSDKDEQKLALLINRAIASADINKLIKQTGLTSKDDETTSKILHMTTNDYVTYKMKFASLYVYNQIITKITDNQMQDTATSLSVKNKASTPVGQLFELFGHRLLSEYKTHTYRIKLMRQGSEITDENILKQQMSFIVLTKHYFSTIPTSLNSNAYYQPNWGLDWPSYDAFISPNLLINFTLNNGHNISINKQLGDIMGLMLKEPPKVVNFLFFVDSAAFENFQLGTVEYPIKGPHGEKDHARDERLTKMKAVKEDFEKYASIYVVECNLLNTLSISKLNPENE